MTSVLEYSGSWWLPEKPENKIHGKLTFDARNRAILSLDGCLEENPDIGSHFEIILGDSYGKKMTLDGCLLTNMTKTITNSKRYVKSDYFVSVSYVGCHFEKREDIRFSRVNVDFSQLADWLGDKLFDTEHKENPDGSGEHVLRLTLPKMKEITFGKMKMTICYGFSEAIGDRVKPKLEASVEMSIEAEKEMDISETLQIVFRLRSFLCLVTGNPISTVRLTGNSRKLEAYERIEILHGKETSGEALFRWFSFPVQYKDISKNLGSHLEKWFGLSGDMEPTYDLYFGTILSQNLYPNHEFLSLTQALESFLSRRFDNNILSPGSFEELQKKLIEIVKKNASEHQQYLEPKIVHEMNRKSFRTKLKKLFESYADLLSLFIEDKEKFIQEVVDTRNYYTHFPKELEEKAVKIEQLPFLSEKLKFTLIAVLLRETGIDDKLIDKALKSYMQFRIRSIT